MQKSKLTLYIFIALILGVLAGYIYNATVINNINTKINAAEVNIKTLDEQIATSADTTTATFKALKKERAAQAIIRKTNDTAREDKLVGFTVLSDIFLRLIKMIVAPLVFTTLVVGVAKVGI
jgi:Na+/H+-dicarboxylate symporter